MDRRQDTPPKPQPPPTPPTPPRPTTPKGRETRARLLASARRLFGERGYGLVRVSDITDAAGISAGAFYRYFEDRRSLMLELLTIFHEDVYRSVSTPWDPDDPRASVEATTLAYLELYGENHDLFGILIELAPSDPHVAEIGLYARRRFHVRIQHSLDRGIREGSIRPDLDTRVAAELLGSMTEFYALQRFNPGYGNTSPASVASIAKTLAEVWTDGVTRRG
ncbi:MAG: TetR/AcrR family transcriptional regulator [Brevibacterium yomogidense]|uniref:TetR/AcrR family transcriptional regulator n=1 Tax=Brevibacterium sp. Mu109 TaxID=1255669 RepID=UPI000C653337|nr:TetR/AcrR family transcriptional regulator [Brevibacterium sp. Mu109]SMX77930.1 transcriptional regulator, TetR family [Brevibacterium sp. Mu109]